MPAYSEDYVKTLAYPRTGKRGVPQQFPRRLYEMLESEAKLAAASPDHPNIISWSSSGKAFGIHDVGLFTSQVLSKYFRTSKFSSFQRNLNLYGFAKDRRGPDADMYSHASFLRGHPELLASLRKCKTVSVRRRMSESSRGSDSDESSSTFRPDASKYHFQQGVTPSPVKGTSSQLSSQAPMHSFQNFPQYVGGAQEEQQRYAAATSTIGYLARNTGSNRLALLATILESAAPLAIKQPA